MDAINEECEVLTSIFEDKFARTADYTFQLKVYSHEDTKFVILDGTWPNDYPDAPINFTLEAFHNKEYAAVGRTKLANDLQAEDAASIHLMSSNATADVQTNKETSQELKQPSERDTIKERQQKTKAQKRRDLERLNGKACDMTTRIRGSPFAIRTRSDAVPMPTVMARGQYLNMQQQMTPMSVGVSNTPSQYSFLYQSKEAENEDDDIDESDGEVDDFGTEIESTDDAFSMFGPQPFSIGCMPINQRTGMNPGLLNEVADKLAAEETRPKTSQLSQSLSPQTSFGGRTTSVDGRRAPRMVHQYVMGDVLGEGSYGKVREAVDANSLRRVAIKIMYRKHLKKIPGGEAAVKREIAIMRRLKHEHVLQLHEVIHDESKQKLYIVMEYVGGGSLQQAIELNDGMPINMKEFHHYSKQIIQAVQYLHGQGIIHRDIKPHNIMLTTSGSVKVSDFGAAEKLELFKSDVCTRSAGSPAFHSPEVAKGDGAFSGEKADIWAVGISMYSMLTGGELPFTGGSLYELYEDIAKGDVILPSYVNDPDLKDLMGHLLDPNPDRRFTAQDAIRHPFLTKSVDTQEGSRSSGSFDFVPYSTGARSISSDAICAETGALSLDNLEVGPRQHIEKSPYTTSAPSIFTDTRSSKTEPTPGISPEITVGQETSAPMADTLTPPAHASMPASRLSPSALQQGTPSAPNALEKSPSTGKNSNSSSSVGQTPGSGPKGRPRGFSMLSSIKTILQTSNMLDLDVPMTSSPQPSPGNGTGVDLTTLPCATPPNRETTPLTPEQFEHWLNTSQRDRTMSVPVPPLDQIIHQELFDDDDDSDSSIDDPEQAQAVAWTSSEPKPSGTFYQTPADRVDKYRAMMAQHKDDDDAFSSDADEYNTEDGSPEVSPPPSHHTHIPAAVPVSAVLGKQHTASSPPAPDRRTATASASALQPDLTVTNVVAVSPTEQQPNRRKKNDKSEYVVTGKSCVLQ